MAKHDFLSEQLSAGSPETDPEVRVLDVESDSAATVFDALRSETARRLYALLREEPRPPTALANELDCTRQTVHYHLDRLADAGVIEPVETRYSAKGVEVTVYATASDPLVVTAGDDDERSRLRELLNRVILAVASLFPTTQSVGDRTAQVADGSIPFRASHLAVLAAGALELVSGPFVLPLLLIVMFGLIHAIVWPEAPHSSPSGVSGPL